MIFILWFDRFYPNWSADILIMEKEDKNIYIDISIILPQKLKLRRGLYEKYIIQFSPDYINDLLISM